MPGQSRPNTNHASFNRSYTYEDYEADGNFTSGTLPFEDTDEVRQRREASEKIDEETDPENFYLYGSPQSTGYHHEEESEFERYPDNSDHSGKGPKGWRRGDEKIYEEANEALIKSHDVDATDIEVNVENGIVTLTGQVDSRFAKREAEFCVENIRGVHDVRNELVIRPS